jgi:hypothetical protein
MYGQIALIAYAGIAVFLGGRALQGAKPRRRLNVVINSCAWPVALLAALFGFGKSHAFTAQTPHPPEPA